MERTERIREGAEVKGPFSYFAGRTDYMSFLRLYSHK
jgi:hypothetical protein